MSSNREFKQQRRLRQRKRHLKVNIWEMLTIFQLLIVARILYIVDNARYKWTVKSAVEANMGNEIFTVVYSVVFKTLKISRCGFADHVKEMCQSACRTCSTIIFLHFTNYITVFWRCRSRRRFKLPDWEFQ